MKKTSDNNNNNNKCIFATVFGPEVGMCYSPLMYSGTPRRARECQVARALPTGGESGAT